MESELLLRCSLAVHEHGAVGVVSDVIADAAHDGATQGAQAARADDDVRHAFLLARRADELARLLDVRQKLAVHLKVTKRNQFRTNNSVTSSDVISTHVLVSHLLLVRLLQLFALLVPALQRVLPRCNREMTSRGSRSGGKGHSHSRVGMAGTSAACASRTTLSARCRCEQ